MNKRILIIAAAVIVFLIGIAGYFLTGKKSPAIQETSPAISSSPTQAVTGKKSLRDLLSLNQPQKCTFTVAADTGQTSGTVYISGQKMRQDSTLVVEGQTTVSHMIIDNNTSYVWIEGQDRGMKIFVDPAATPVPTVTGSPQQIDWDSRIDYQCDSWIVDPAMFELPGQIKFTELKDMLVVPTIAGTGNNCSACNSLSGEAKTQCLKIMNCN